jgi:hypothetical protein
MAQKQKVPQLENIRQLVYVVLIVVYVRDTIQRAFSRCPRCCGLDFFDKHPSCSFISCYVKKKRFEVAAECPEFLCLKFKPKLLLNNLGLINLSKVKDKSIGD